MSLATSLSSSPVAQLPLPSNSAVTAKAAESSSSPSASKSGASTADSIGTTFLSLLVQELQNQDPTAPMDSTAMVGQMISLNQLNQLTSINQVLSNAYRNDTSSSTPAAGKAEAAAGAAVQTLSNNGVPAYRAVAPSVTLPAF